MRKIIKEITRNLVVNSVENGDNVLSANEVDMLLTMDKEEAEFFNARIKFGSCNVMHVDNFIGDDTIDINTNIITKGSGLIGTKPVFNSDGVFIKVGSVFNNQYEPRLGGYIFHYVKRYGNIRDKVHYGL